MAIKYIYIFLTLLIFTVNLTIIDAYAIDKPITTDSRIKRFVYSDNEVFPVVLHYGYHTVIEFGKGESVQNYSVGNSYAWQFVQRYGAIFITPMEENIATNMTIITNKRRYYLELQSKRMSEAIDQDLAYVVRFFYPDDEDDIVKPEQVTTINDSQKSRQSSYASKVHNLQSKQQNSTGCYNNDQVYNSSNRYNNNDINSNSNIDNINNTNNINNHVIEAINYNNTTNNTTKIHNITKTYKSKFPNLATIKPYNFNYTATGSIKLTPSVIFDNGVSTYFKYDNENVKNKKFFAIIDNIPVQMEVYQRGKYHIVNNIAKQFEIMSPNNQKVTIFAR